MIGRQAELALLIDRAKQAERGAGSTVIISGEAGIGKSRLMLELVRHTTLELLWINADPYEILTAYGVARRVLRPLLDIEDDASDDVVVERLSRLADAAPWTTPYLSLAALAVGVVLPPTQEVSDLNVAFRRTTMHRVMFALLEATPATPRLMVVDDLYWADEASIDLLGAMAVLVSDRPWMVCLGTRHPWTPKRAALIELEPLPAHEATLLTRTVLGDALTQRDRDQLDGRGGGNPLFLIELARAAMAQGSATDLPESIESLLTARIDLLAPSDRDLLRSASVLGTLIDIDLLGTALDDPTVHDSNRWARLDGFVGLRLDGGYRFHHALVQEAAYEGLPFSRRRQLHGAVGEALERETDRAEQYAATMALHFALAGDHERGWRYSVAAADQAKAAYANADAQASYRQALREVAHLRDVDATSIARVEEAFGDVCDLTGQFVEAAGAYRRARRLAPSTRLLRKSGLMYERSGEYDKAMRYYRRARTALGRSTAPGDVAERALVLADSAGARYRQGRLRDALKLGIDAATEAQSAGDPLALARATFLLELVMSELGFVGKSVELFRVAGDLNGEADAHNNRGIAAYYRGDWGSSLIEYEASRELFDRTGDVVGSATAHNNIGEILSDQGHLTDALERFKQAETGFRDANYPIGVAVTVSNRARVAARTGQYDTALALYGDALERFEALDAGAFVIEQWARRLECLLLAGRITDAVEEESALVAKAGAAVDSHTGATVLRLRGWLALCRELHDAADEHLAKSLHEAVLADARFERALTLLVVAELRRRQQRDPAVPTTEAREELNSLEVLSVAGWPFADHAD